MRKYMDQSPCFTSKAPLFLVTINSQSYRPSPSPAAQCGQELWAVLRIRIRDPVLFWPLDPGRVKHRDATQPGYISESLETNFWVKILKFFDVDPGSGIAKIRIRDKTSRIRNIGYGSEECIAHPFLKVLRTLFLDAVNTASTAAGFET